MKDKVYSQFEFARKKKNLKILEDLYYKYPNEVYIKFEYAKLLIERKFIEEGKELLIELASGDNEDYALLELGKVYVFEGNIDEARKCFKKLSDKGDCYGKIELAMLEMNEENYDIARQLLNDLIIKSDSQRAKIELARLEKLVGNKSGAYEAFTELSKQENGYIVKYDLAKLELEKGRLDVAKNLFISLLDTPICDKAKFEIAKIESEIGNINEARFYFQELIGTSKDKYSKFELGRLESKVENFDKARKIFEKLYEETNSYYVLAELGILEANSGNLNKARMYFKKLIAEEKNMYAYRLLLMLEVKNKNYIDALKLINEMRKNGLPINMHVAVYLSKELNIFINGYDYRIALQNYCNKQIINYNRDLALNHIIDRHCYGEDIECFNKDINIENLYDVLRENLSEEYKVHGFGFNDNYYIPCENIGRNNQQYIKVVTLPNTHDIISMYPVHNKYLVSDDDEELVINKQVLMKRGR